MPFESTKSPLLSPDAYRHRKLKFAFYSLLILFLSLLMGIAGYHFFGNLTWIDSLVNASMILTGMGPVNILTEAKGKFFESFYALYSGVAFLSIVGVLFAPIVHRFLHSLHIDDDK